MHDRKKVVLGIPVAGGRGRLPAAGQKSNAVSQACAQFPSDVPVVRDTGCGEKFPGALKALVADPGEAFPARGPVQVIRPLQLRRRVLVEGFIKEAPADLVPDQGLPCRGSGQAQGFLLQPRGLVPSVLALVGVGQHEQGPEPVRRSCQQRPAFGNSLPSTVQQGQCPGPFQARVLPQSGRHRSPVQDHVPQRRGVGAPDLSIGSH